MADKAASRRQPTRRQFLARTASAAAALAASQSVLGAPAILVDAATAPPSERFRIGHIGIGGRGGSLLGQSLGTRDVDVVAVCDVDRQHLGAAAERAGKDAGTSTDYREVLDRKDVDAVVIATPDHWHALTTIDACAAGKDVYVEKPLCTFIADGRRMVQAARRHERVVQMGIHHRSAPYIHAVVEAIRSGRIGKVTAVKTWMWDNPFKAKTPGGEPPTHLDFDRWLGPAPKVPYHPDRTHYNFRWCADYAGGYMTDWGVHMMDVVTYAMDIDHKGPESVEASGEPFENNLYDFPRTMEARWEYKDPDFTLTWTQPTAGEGVPERDIVPGQKYGMTFYGEAGQLRTYFGGHEFWADGKKAPLPEPRRAFDLPESPGHFRNWLDCIRSRERPIADVEIGHRTTALCILGNIALARGVPLHWDWREERFPEDAAGNRLLSREDRAPYTARDAKA